MKMLKKIDRLSAVSICLLLSGAAVAQSRFSYSMDGSEVTDSRTSLIWQRCSAGQTWRGSTCTGTASMFTHEAALAYAQTQIGWRLPNVKELSSLVDKTKSNPTIDSTAFPAVALSWYWSSSPFVGHSSLAWLISFGSGDTTYEYRISSFPVRLVR